MKQLPVVNPFNAPVYHEKTVSSTMDVSRILSSNGEPHGTVITADFQETGRGRIKGRLWEMDKENNLPFTILLRYPRLEDIPPALSLRTGLAVALAIEAFTPVLAGKVVIKWPNDVLVKNAETASDAHSALKVAGILAEAEGGNVHIGVGVNLAQKQFPAHLNNKATSITIAAGAYGREINGDRRFYLLELLLAYLYKEFGLDNNADNSWKRRIEERLYKNGEKVTFYDGLADSGKTVTGILTGIGPGGELLIVPNGESKVRSFVTGELQLM